MTRVLVLGGAGMLGHKMLQIIGTRFPDTLCTVHGDLMASSFARVPLLSPDRTLSHMDALEFERFASRVRDLRPEVLVNCIGIIKRRPEAADAIPSIYVNALFPHKLAELVQEWGGRLILFSTDCVFDGKRGGYTETDRSTAEDLYGLTKFLGEVRRDHVLCLRTSIIGRELRHFASLLEWFLAQEGKRIQGYQRVIYAGVTTNYLAGLVCRILEEHPQLSGLYQVTGPPVSKYSLLCRLREAYGLNVTIEPEQETVSDRSMIGDRFHDATGFERPTWDALLHELATDPTPYEKWR